MLGTRTHRLVLVVRYMIKYPRDKIRFRNGDCVLCQEDHDILSLNSPGIQCVGV